MLRMSSMNWKLVGEREREREREKHANIFQLATISHQIQEQLNAFPAHCFRNEGS